MPLNDCRRHVNDQRFSIFNKGAMVALTFSPNKQVVFCERSCSALPDKRRITKNPLVLSCSYSPLLSPPHLTCGMKAPKTQREAGWSNHVAIWWFFTVGGMLMVEIFSIAKSFPLTKLFYLEKISMAKSLHIMNLSAVGDKMT